MATPDDVLQRLFRVTVAMSDAMSEDLARRGLTRARATVLSVLRDAGPINQVTIARALRVSPRNVTGLVNGLEDNRLARRVPHPTDGRAALVILTDEGTRAASALARDERELAEFLFAGRAPAERQTLTSGLEQILERLDEPEFQVMRRAAFRRWSRRLTPRRAAPRSPSELQRPG